MKKTYLRELLATTHRELGDYLDISRSNLSMIELRKRKFNKENADRYYALSEKIESLKNTDYPEPGIYITQENEEYSSWRDKHISRIKLDIMHTRKEIKKLNRDYENSLMMLKILPRLEVQPGKRQRIQEAVISIWKENNRVRLQKSGQINRKKLEIKITTLQMELEMLQAQPGS